ncbi:hypothetical protein ERJ75_000220500 [Trypanosoma vivax]|nr:hypothetical protein TRVL_04279 [Trypanosoma vivax]KAH8618976.1 hypothetical protein ERJ75_000221200 [Trypanosoma vivax]KAH8618989.1 hypothetical protein ERJ75_000220500 [Trypanosoma vivax]
MPYRPRSSLFPGAVCLLASNKTHEPLSHNALNCGTPFARSESISLCSAQAFVGSGPLGAPGDTGPPLFKALSVPQRVAPLARLDVRRPRAREAVGYKRTCPADSGCLRGKFRQRPVPIPPFHPMHLATKIRPLAALEKCRGTLLKSAPARSPPITRARPRACESFLQP